MQTTCELILFTVPVQVYNPLTNFFVESNERMSPTTVPTLTFLSDGREAGALMRAHDWRKQHRSPAMGGSLLLSRQYVRTSAYRNWMSGCMGYISP